MCHDTQSVSNFLLRLKFIYHTFKSIYNDVIGAQFTVLVLGVEKFHAINSLQVSFSRHFLGQLVTSGIGHIRFWKMANTFTGPKLEVRRLSNALEELIDHIYFVSILPMDN